MDIVLDTHILLWAMGDTGRLPNWALEAIESTDNRIFYSVASIWEIAIKMKVGKLQLTCQPLEIAGGALATGFLELPIYASHAAKVLDLPLYHRDPFDRLLVAQAILSNAQLLTADTALKPYSSLVRII
ncbi:MAG: type II toxin-antitoxin system VapC family toxin [Methylomonas sp.]|nr:type II toxin-antitoxin system VapC family toxin [Methylomonas sp.]PPD20515.1 MAG: PIN domain nuclease [Methylomonas sp.]PPD26806.1 MAG: PIN domain nuclease [Methylomonas sp.]PPD38670.1 MAG: PIN domain nuclease [Methylomonas sp.]PPD40803.1 MAG: PIN domain nuclease [Methylomonas sp.]